MKKIFALFICLILLAGVSFAAVFAPPHNGAPTEKSWFWSTLFKSGKGITGASIATTQTGGYYASSGISVYEKPTVTFGKYYTVSQVSPYQTQARYRPVGQKCSYFGCK